MPFTMKVPAPAPLCSNEAGNNDAVVEVLESKVENGCTEEATIATPLSNW